MTNINKFKIVADSSCDISKLEKVAFETASLKISTNERDFTDDPELDTHEMVEYLLNHKGRSRSSCPNVEDWLKAYGDSEFIICITITSKLSGSYNSAMIAKKQYEKRYNGRKVFVFDSLSTGPEMALLIQKTQELILEGLSYDDIVSSLKEYSSNTGLLFILESMKNLANNGRVSPLVAKIAGILGIRVIGKASDEGELEILNKCRGGKKALEEVVEYLIKKGVSKGKINITHCINSEMAENLKNTISKLIPNANVEIRPTGGLCSFYAEKGGLLIGYEKF